jgi:type IV pilus assembly protein PilM
VIGLDIGASTLKIVELEGLNGKVAVKKIASGQYSENYGVDEAEQVREAVYRTIGEHGIKAKRVVSAIAKKDVIEKFLQIPVIDEKKIRDILKWEVSKHISFPLEQVVYDYRIDDIPGEAKVSVHLAIARRSRIENHIDILRSLGLVPVAVEPMSLSLFRIARSLVEIGDRPLAILDIGAHSSTLLIVTGGKMRLSRMIEIGSEDIMSSIVNLIQCSREEAGTLMSSVGISDEILQGQEVSATSKEFETYSAIEYQMDRLIGELRRSLVFFMAQYEGEDEPETLCLTGGTAGIPNLKQFLEKKLGLKSEVIDPLKNPDWNGCTHDNSGCYLSMAFGLALRGCI